MRSACWSDADYPITQPWLPGPPAVHCGIDIGCPSGTIIKAARAGVVETVEVGMVGIHVQGSGERDFYLHGYSLVVVGQKVSAGFPVIHSGMVEVDPRFPLTGPHLHFEVQDGYSLPGAPPFAPQHSLDPVPILLGGAMTPQLAEIIYRQGYWDIRGDEPSQAELDGWMAHGSDDETVRRNFVAILDSPEGIKWKQALQAAVKGGGEYAAKTHVHVNPSTTTGPSQ